MATVVKICGITRVEDGLAAAHAGAHAIGLVFHPASPRFVTIDRAREIAQRIPPFVTVVGLFVNPDPQTVEAVLREVPLQLLQFHGDESPELCAGFGLPYLKAVRMAPGTDLLQYAARYGGAKLCFWTPSKTGCTAAAEKHSNGGRFLETCRCRWSWRAGSPCIMSAKRFARLAPGRWM